MCNDPRLPWRFLWPEADLPRVPARWWEAIGISFLLVVAALVFMIVGTVAAVLVTGIPPSMTGLLGAFLGSFVSMFALLVGYVWLRRGGSPLPVLGFRAVRPGLGLAALVVAAVGLALISLLTTLAVPEAWQQTRFVTGTLRGGSRVQVGLIFLLAVVAAPLIEEPWIRGYLFPAVGQRFGFLTGALASSLIFGVLHLPYPGAMLGGFLFGLVFCWVYRTTGSIWPSIVLHAANNALALSLTLTLTG